MKVCVTEQDTADTVCLAALTMATPGVDAEMLRQQLAALRLQLAKHPALVSGGGAQSLLEGVSDSLLGQH